MARAFFRDESPMGDRLDTFALDDLPDRTTVRELVRLRVREEVERHNARRPAVFRGLVQPGPVEAELNGTSRRRRHVDCGRQVEAAERAFQRNGFVLIVGDRQVEDLDETVDLTADPEITFIKLVPLVGG
ncbi:hypothetical protein NI17_014505 [Thermobifida halotolerans]|uniref:Uncharacterized protein n=1 Tax=Thermobifida halotolerans TaxID=483545 RepID=A0A399G4S5_9ACTN|nr:hypothetical protein [Thermobifida halotolerans]UOE18060.1 hypothetical protein NI17_014505 [Thermobifida halotolerans]